jgi:hypothetical protein
MAPVRKLAAIRMRESLDRMEGLRGIGRGALVEVLVLPFRFGEEQAAFRE